MNNQDMKKIVLSGMLMLMIHLAVAQRNISFNKVSVLFKFGPQISMTDVNSSNIYNISAHGAGVRYAGGVELDFNLRRNIAFTLGMNYSQKRVGLSDGTNTAVYNLHYLQLPIGFKFQTDEIARDINLYFAGGLLAEIRMVESNQNNTELALTQSAFASSNQTVMTFPLQVGFYAGGGVEWLVTPNNQIVMGVNYQRGFANVINPFLKDPSGAIIANNLNVQTGMICFEFGFKFL
jgi:Outer membrane protein beta-barrel domain